uniref:Uncharacterized protein n=1 Tax=Dunaliella tertiolecta TaxID=3047 RepID=A0A6S8IUM9_DUNTE
MRCEVCDTRRGYSTADAHAHPNVSRPQASALPSNALKALQKSSPAPSNTHRALQKSGSGAHPTQQPLKRKHPQQQHSYPSKQGPSCAPSGHNSQSHQVLARPPQQQQQFHSVSTSHNTQSHQATVHPPQQRQHQQTQQHQHQQRQKQQHSQPKQASITSLLQRAAATGGRPGTKAG